jgi:hypothetical protein
MSRLQPARGDLIDLGCRATKDLQWVPVEALPVLSYERVLAAQITGPLIRIIGDRFASGVKAAILGTMSALLGKAGPALKPFLPQLQTTFLKCLTDPVRGRWT